MNSLGAVVQWEHCVVILKIISGDDVDNNDKIVDDDDVDDDEDNRIDRK